MTQRLGVGLPVLSQRHNNCGGGAAIFKQIFADIKRELNAILAVVKRLGWETAEAFRQDLTVSEEMKPVTRKRILRLQQQRHLLKAYWRDTMLLLRQFRLSLVAFILLIVWGATWLWLFYPEKGLDFTEALYATLMLVFLNPTLEFPNSGLVRPIFFVVPLVGVGIFTEAVVRFVVLLFAKSYRQEEWQRVMASTYRNHIVVVGIERVGYRVVQELLKAGEEVVAITKMDGENQHLVNELRGAGVPVITDDARRVEVLRDAQIEHARCLLLCQSDDLANLEIALKAKELNPDLRIVARMFSDELAERAEKMMGIQVAISTSAIAAPAFVAAALQQAVTHAFYVGEHLFHVAELNITPHSPFSERTVGEVEQQHPLSIILIRRADGTIIHHPDVKTCIRRGDTLVILGTPEQVAAVQT